MYYLLLVIGLPFALIFFKPKVTYEGGIKFKIPRSVIFISGHKSWLDAVGFAYLFFFRRLYFVTTNWYHGMRIIFKPFMLLLGAILVDIKTEKFDFVSRSKKILSKNNSVLIYPEGDYITNKYLFEFGQFKPGYLFLAMKSGAPIVPVISDFSYGIFKRLHFKIGRAIYPTFGNGDESIRNQCLILNETIKKKCQDLFYELKREKAKQIKASYTFKEFKKGDVIRINGGLYYHYGIYLDDKHVLEFGHLENTKNEKIDVHFTSLNLFCSGKIPEVRVLSNRKKARSIRDVEHYINEVIGQEGYSLANNNCLDLVNRITLTI